MKGKNTSMKNFSLLILFGTLLSMLTITAFLYMRTREITFVFYGLAFTLSALMWMICLILGFSKKLTMFTENICDILDKMISNNFNPNYNNDNGDTIFSRISYRLFRLYDVMQENRKKVDEDRNELQSLISDISHQLRTPLSNLKLVTDTLIEKPVNEKDRIEFLHGIRNQIEKLDFLIQGLVKMSRLETSTIQLKKCTNYIIDTLTQAMSGIIYEAEKKNIHVTINCPEDLKFKYDNKWTAEAIFNLLDNAVKYTPNGGEITVTVEELEMYVQIKVKDTGKGITESNQASIFRRFYREEEVHSIKGVGLGLYLARDIVSKQGGYIGVLSSLGHGSEFNIMLPIR